MHAAVRYDNIGHMIEAPILICYDGSEGAKRAIDAAAALLGPRRAIVVDIGPVLTAEESVAVLAPVSPAVAFEEQNTEDALRSAREGAERARSRRGGRGADRARLPGAERRTRTARGKRLPRGRGACGPAGPDCAGGVSVSYALAQVTPMLSAGFAAAVMVQLGASKRMLVVRRPPRCAACGVERSSCRCDA
jgi:hypothetical protein